LLSLIGRGTFCLVVKDDTVHKPDVVPSRFVLAIKTKDGKDALKARFFLGGHRDRNKNKLVHSSTTLKQSSVRLLLATAAIMGFDVISADVIQSLPSERLRSQTQGIRETELHRPGSG
jgi:hypothetical protein